MKLRIQDNSVRFRMTQKEVACLRDAGRVESEVVFPAGRLRYSVAASDEVTVIAVAYDDNAVRVLLPRTMAMAWANSDEVGLGGIEGSVRILVEKDFQCLHKSDERDPDAYPNPFDQ